MHFARRSFGSRQSVVHYRYRGPRMWGQLERERDRSILQLCDPLVLHLSGQYRSLSLSHQPGLLVYM